MDQALAANMAKRAALRTKQSNIGGCAACVAPNLGLSGVGTTIAANMAKRAVDRQKGLGSFVSDYVTPNLKCILITSLIAGFAGWKLGKIMR